MKIAVLALFPLLGVAQQNDLTSSYSTITPADRLRWVIDTTVNPAGLLGHASSAGLATWADSPKELGVHWTGFEKRYINNVTTSILGNSIEAGVGAIWDEEPRPLHPRPEMDCAGAPR